MNKGMELIIWIFILAVGLSIPLLFILGLGGILDLAYRTLTGQE